MRRLFLTSAALAALAFAACDGSTLSQPGAVAPAPDPTTGTSGGDPGDPMMTSGGVPGTDGGPPVVIGPDTVSVIVEPTDRAQALLTAIQGAKKSVHMTMYLLDDSRFINALVAQHTAGLDVKVVLNHTFPGGTGSNSSTYDQLHTAGVPVVWAPATFTLTHEKCIVIDAAEAWIMTMNLEVTSSTKNREFLAVDTQAPDVAEADAIFAADFAGTAITPTGNLLVAPVNARDKLLALITGAKKTVDLEGEELSDYKIVDALVTAKKAGVAVRVVLATGTPTDSQTSAIQELKLGGVPVVSVNTPYIHAKAVVADGTSAYVGSENFTTGSLQYNRELGLITTNATATASVAQTIAADFASGTAL